MSSPDPLSEPARFYGYAARRQARGLATQPRPHDHRVPEARHVEMLRLRLVEGLTLREVGELTGITGERVKQLLGLYFGAACTQAKGRARERGRGRLKVPPGFVDVLREIVECGHGSGIVTALRDRLELERQSIGSKVPGRVARRNVRLIQAFLKNAGVDDGSVVAVTLHAKAVTLVRLGLLGELGNAAEAINEAIGREGYDKAAEWYAEQLKRQDATRALLDAMGWENVENPRPVTVYLDVHRDALLHAIRNNLDQQITVAGHPDMSDEKRAAAEASRALLEKLLAAIGGEA
jgi:hypothetical protein